MFGHMGSFGGYGFGNGYGPGIGNGFGYGMMGGGGFTGILFLIIFGFLVYLLMKKNQPGETVFRGQQTFNANNESLEIAKLRYVRGEISYDEYQEIVKVLNEGGK